MPWPLTLKTRTHFRSLTWLGMRLAALQGLQLLRALQGGQAQLQALQGGLQGLQLLRAP